MKELTMKQLASALGVDVTSAGDSVMVSAGISTDTRTVKKGSLFVALRGENFDAHDFLQEAVDKGAVGLLVDQADKIPSGVPALVVEDSLEGLQKLAAWYRVELGKGGLKVLAITGSNGKTSTKDLCKAVLGKRYRVRATRGNLNNHIGLPLSVLEAEEEDEVCVWEMGMNHPGELAPLCEIARPDLSIITNVGTAHIEYMGTREAIALEKGAVAEALTAEGTLLVPASCDFVNDFRQRTAGRVLLVDGDKAEVRAERIQATQQGSEFDLVWDTPTGEKRAKAKLPVAGRHMVSNALLAAGVGLVLGMEIQAVAEGLASLELSGGRLHCYESHGVGVIDDTYNANPDSMKAAIETLANMESAGQKVIVLGKMAELGEQAQAAHEEIGKKAAEKALVVLSVGAEAEGIYQGAQSISGTEAQHFENQDKAVEWLLANCSKGDSVLFKGSRAAAMEQLMNKVFPAH